ncbi:MAG TPA: tRNA (adenosine(37)-N6)-threonylcarbamoyltransferase complex ATPase subunit type 1 TsaE [Candidatus Saccharicenans sp.]|nr:tRNA (adenosine(37)-N6)-threonylcarbamoyltransferase complex ATPase subunit type 1 TsaE [Candidatus Saccharicenans sp.]HNT00496.1 tRNA (adenosine(37)-N6)-threonylcarbamoyltransferase complex ATPase subunit type 1 TsaE [Candidatus Saccharicenans sp.]
MMKIDSCDLTLLARSEEETFELARKLGQTLQGEEVILLIGELGAGKTLMVAGLAAGLGVNEQTYVCSPSFTLINVYQGRVTLYHLDLYRLSDPEEIVDLGLEDLLGSGIVAIEWAEKLPYEIKGVKVIKIFIEVINEDQRRITISGLEPESDFIGGQDSGKN